MLVDGLRFGVYLISAYFLFKGHCYGCINNGSPDMRHPKDTSAYTGGHLDGYLPFGDDGLSGSDEDVCYFTSLKFMII